MQRHVKLISIVLVGVALGCASALSGEDQQKEWQVLVREAESRLEAKDFAEAQKLLQNALDAGIPVGKRWSVLYSLGLAYSQTNDWAKAEKYLKRALQEGEGVLGREDPLLSRLTNVFAGVYQNTGQDALPNESHK